MGSTPSRAPSTTWSRLASMNSTTCATGGRAPPRESRSPLQDLVRPPQLPILLLQIRDPSRVHGRGPRCLPVIDVGLGHPRPHRLDPVSQLGRDPMHRALISAQLGPQTAHHPDSCGLLLPGIPTRSRLPRRLFSRHDSILVSKARSLHHTQSGSVAGRVAKYRPVVVGVGARRVSREAPQPATPEATADSRASGPPDRRRPTPPDAAPPRSHTPPDHVKANRSDPKRPDCPDITPECEVRHTCCIDGPGTVPPCQRALDSLVRIDRSLAIL